MSKKIFSLSNLNITFSLEFCNKDIEKYSINFTELNTLKDLSFIKNDPNLFDKIELKSNDDLINILLYMNRINKNKIFIQYITLNEIYFNEEQKEFKDFIYKLMESNFLFVSSEKIFNSINNTINLEIIYGNEKKIFPLNSTQDDDKEDKNNFIEFSNDKSLFSNFDYFFLDLNKIKEIYNLINIKSLKIFFSDLKHNFGIKIISYLNDNSIDKLEDTFFDLIDILLFQNKNIMQNILKNVKQKKINKIQKKENFFKNKIFPPNKNNKINIMCRNIKTIKHNNINYIDTNKSNILKDINNVDNKGYLLTKSFNETNDLSKYFKENNYEEKYKLKIDNKIIIFLDDFKSINFCIPNKAQNKPFKYSFKFKIFPEINIHNIEEINIYKSIIKKNEEIYSIIIFSSVLSVLLEENINDQTIIKGFLLSNNCIKKILEFEKNNKIFPKNKQIFLSELNKKDIKNFKYTPQTESRFILDGNDLKIKKKLYNPLTDKCSKTFFSTETSRDVIKKNGLIDNKGNLFYDKVYKDSMGVNPKYKVYRKITDKELYNDIYSMNRLKNIRNKVIENINEKISKKFILNKKMIGYNKKTYQYSIYYNAVKKSLPKITLRKTKI